MPPKITICIPVYNFANYIVETLDSIIEQIDSESIEIVILDGASTDNTYEIIDDYKKRHDYLKYIVMPQKGGIDRDIDHAVSHASGEYVWLFSGDDWMLPGALTKIAGQLDSKCDLYLTKHLEWVESISEWIVWPTLNISNDSVFDTSNYDDRRDYFVKAANTEAFFSFIGGIVVKRSTWERVRLDEKFIDSCWAHAARLCRLLNDGLTIKVLAEPYLRRRPDNDSFAQRGLVDRLRLTIDGYNAIADEIFGHDSFEAFHIRRAIRCEYQPLVMQLGKYLCAIDPEHEDINLMNRLMSKTYCDFTIIDLRARINYALMTPARFRRRYPELSQKYDKLKSR